jgi:hypothetical protein
MQFSFPYTLSIKDGFVQNAEETRVNEPLLNFHSPFDDDLLDSHEVQQPTPTRAHAQT